jgi:hypothetical protein
MGRGVKIPWVGGQITMDRVVKIPWIGVRYTMGRGGQNTMDRGSIYHG